MEQKIFHGFAVLCDPDGRIEIILRNDLKNILNPRPGAPLSTLIDEADLPDYYTFLYRLKNETVLHDWQLKIDSAAEPRELYFTGGTFDGRIFIIASSLTTEAAEFIDELGRINNEQADMLRRAMKKESRDDQEVFRDFARVNNELTNLQRELHKKNHELTRTLQERDRFIGMAAHDLRSPLSGISGLCGLLLDGRMGELSKDQQEIIQTICESSEYMVQMVNDMLDLAAIESGTLQLNIRKADLVKIIRDSYSINRQIAEQKEICLTIKTEQDSIPLEIDGVKIRQVADNLISNAIKFSHPGTAVQVRVMQNGDYAEVSVRDQGQGIPAEELPKLFTPYSRVNVSSTAGEKSTGLGLAISQRIIQGHRGTLRVESEVGRGSDFRFSLPLKPVDENTTA
ncbi:HAMP domain-containing sensor histidine kinase [Marispirochaeta aestuarii]|uniref:sensor histidine kinase n=1 Tax=Marispirochaeta aestuarii TaxID=1963862 RepID=UPI0029C600B8|nr:HAMP domain-containing sensor histidine kinase [Marispirochaeta aestuarii]